MSIRSLYDKNIPPVRHNNEPRKNLLYTQSQLVGDESLITRHGWARVVLFVFWCATVRRFIDSIRGVCYPLTKPHIDKLDASKLGGRSDSNSDSGKVVVKSD